MHLIPFDTIWFHQGVKTHTHGCHCGLTSLAVTMVSSQGRVMSESEKSLVLVLSLQKKELGKGTFEVNWEDLGNKNLARF